MATYSKGVNVCYYAKADIQEYMPLPLLYLLLIALGLIGAYLIVMIYSNLQPNITVTDVMFNSWVFDSNKLNQTGKRYRKALFYYFLVVIAAVILIENI